MIVNNFEELKPEEKARVKIDNFLYDTGWNVKDRDCYVPIDSVAIRESLMKDNKESDYLFFIDNKAIAVLEAKREENLLGSNVKIQAETYATTPLDWYGLWFENKIPLVYISNGEKIYFKNTLDEKSEYIELKEMDSPKDMLKKINKQSETKFGALPVLDNRKNDLRECQYDAEITFENSLKTGKKRALAILATGSGKTYLSCLTSYRLLNYTNVKRVLFLVDRNNLAKQALGEFSSFSRTENNEKLSDLYIINKLKSNDDIKSDIVISTIQKLYAVLTGNKLVDTNEDEEDEILYNNENSESQNEQLIELGNELGLPRDYFDLIIVDECHRSIYGKWKAVLEYFNNAYILGLTATPTEEAYAFFNKNIVEKYTYDQSVVDNVNVPSRIYRIKTKTTTFGGSINVGNIINELTKKTGEVHKLESGFKFDFTSNLLDKTITDEKQIKMVLESYRDSIYTDLYPDRDEDYRYIPKTLIFAKNDEHAKNIERICKDVFKEKIADDALLDKYVQRITYSAEDSNELIRQLNHEKNFRIAITVTLVATGTDVKPLEVVMFMSNVKSDVLYTQMKGRGCRTINVEKFREITPNAKNKECFYIVDAIGVTESEKKIPIITKNEPKENKLSLEKLLEKIAHGELSDENLILLRDKLSIIHGRYENDIFFGKHLTSFISKYGFSPRNLAEKINNALDNNLFPAFTSASKSNNERKQLVAELINNINAREHLLELQRGYQVAINENEDELLYKGFSIETAKPFIENFEAYINSHKDDIEALRKLYNNDCVIQNNELVDLRDKLMGFDKLYTPYNIWSNYYTIDKKNVDNIDSKYNVNAITNYIPLCSFALKKSLILKSLHKGYSQKYNLYLGMSQRTLTDSQEKVMKRIADYIINDGALTANMLNQIDTDLWRSGCIEFNSNVKQLDMEMSTLSKFILKVA